MTAFAKNLMVLTDRSGTIVFVSPEVESWSGYSVAESVGQKPGRLWGGNMDSTFYEGFWKKLASEHKPFISRIENRAKSGRDLPSLIGVLPILESGEIKYFLAVQPEKSGWNYFEKEFGKEAARLAENPVALSSWLSHWEIDTPKSSDHCGVAHWLEQALVSPLRGRFQHRFEDERLITMAKSRPDDYAEMFKKYYPLIVGYLARRLPESADAEDIAQEVFMKAMGKLATFESKNASYKTYLLRIAHNELLNRYRRQSLECRPVAFHDRDVNELVELERRDLLERALTKLSGRDQQILKEFYLASKPVDQIAEDMGISENAVKLALSRSRKRLRRFI